MQGVSWLHVDVRERANDVCVLDRSVLDARGFGVHAAFPPIDGAFIVVAGGGEVGPTGFWWQLGRKQMPCGIVVTTAVVAVLSVRLLLGVGMVSLAVGAVAVVVYCLWAGPRRAGMKRESGPASA